MKDDGVQVNFYEGYSINEIHAPKSFFHKSIRELNIRARFGVDVLSIKRKTKHDYKVMPIPNPDFKIEPDDILIIAGEIKNINLLKNIE